METRLQHIKEFLHQMCCAGRLVGVEECDHLLQALTLCGSPLDVDLKSL